MKKSRKIKIIRWSFVVEISMDMIEQDFMRSLDCPKNPEQIALENEARLAEKKKKMKPRRKNKKARK